MEDLLHWQDLSTGLWFCVIVESNPLASLKSASTFLDSITWRASGKITEAEFGAIFHDWSRRSKPMPHYVVREPDLTVSLSKFRGLMVAKQLNVASEIQQMLGILVNETNKTELRAGYFTPQWLAIIETLFFALDVRGRGFITVQDLLWLALAEATLPDREAPGVRLKSVMAATRHRLADFGARRSPLESPYCGRVSLFCFKQHIKRCASKLDRKHPFNALNLQKMIARLQRVADVCDTSMRPSREVVLGWDERIDADGNKGKKVALRLDPKVVLWTVEQAPVMQWAQEVDDIQALESRMFSMMNAEGLAEDVAGSQRCLLHTLKRFEVLTLRAMSMYNDGMNDAASESSSSCSASSLGLAKGSGGRSGVELQARKEDVGSDSRSGGSVAGVSVSRGVSGNATAVSDEASVRRSESVTGHSVEERNDYASVYSQAMRLFQQENNISDDELVWRWEQASARVRQLFLLIVQSKDVSPLPHISGSGFARDICPAYLTDSLEEVDVDEAVEGLLRYTIANSPLQTLEESKQEPGRSIQQTLKRGTVEVKLPGTSTYELRELTLVLKEAAGRLEGVLLSAGKPRVHIALASSQVVSGE